jgi:2',3'-cyclic-nucleotide 2'-phosphodiesterase (5'-nucleotidase family)
MKPKTAVSRFLSALLLVSILIGLFPGISMQAQAGGAPPGKLAALTVTTMADDDKPITIFHTNDLHGSVAGALPSTVSQIAKIAELKINTQNSLLDDAGDATQGNAFATLTKGADVIALMNMAGYDVMAAGNHEFDYGLGQLISNAQSASFPILSANTEKDGKPVLENVGYDNNTKINNGAWYIKEINGVKVGFFGITTPETATKTNPEGIAGVTFKETVAEIVTVSNGQIIALKNAGADMIVGLMHLGIDDSSTITSRAVAAAFAAGNKPDVIIDGHSHSVVNETVNGIYIAQAGNGGNNVGKVDITFDASSGTVTGITGSQISLSGLTEYDLTVETEAKLLLTAQQSLLSPVVGKTATTLWGGTINGLNEARIYETNLSSLIADAMLDAAKTAVNGNPAYNGMPVVALQNGGGVRTTIYAGSITIGDVIGVLPFGNSLAYKLVTPKVLFEALENAVGKITAQDTLTGKITGADGRFPQIAGMRFEFDPDGTATTYDGSNNPITYGSRVTKFMLLNADGSDGPELSRSDNTTPIILASNDFEIAGGDGYILLKGLQSVGEGGVLDEVFANYIEKITVAGGGEFSYPNTMGRILTVGAYTPTTYTAYVNLKKDANTVWDSADVTYKVDGIAKTGATDESGKLTIEGLSDGPHAITFANANDVLVNNYSGAGLEGGTEVAVITTNSDAPVGAYKVKAPTKNIEINFWLDSDGVPYYNVLQNGEMLIKASALGLRTSLADMKNGFAVIKTTNSSANSSWSPLVGDKEIIIDRYNQTAFELTHSSGKVLTVEMRAYDTGVAFRYILPDEANDYDVNSEYTQFVFPNGVLTQAHMDQNQTITTPTRVENFPANRTIRSPLTAEYPNGAAMTICSAKADNYSFMNLTRDTSTATGLRVVYLRGLSSNISDLDTVKVKNNSPASTPWRTFVIGETLAELPINSDIILNLNTPADESLYKFSEWVRPGKNLMTDGGLTTASLKDWINCAKEQKFEYVLLDYGWYGPEMDERCDPRLDPALLEPDSSDSPVLAAAKAIMKQYVIGYGQMNHPGFPPYGRVDQTGTMSPRLNIPEVCQYANEQGVGLILYVNDRHLFDTLGRYTVDELFEIFEQWGAAGVKPGFVQVRSQEYEKRNEDMIASAAKHKLILTIHDEYVSSGLERTYPNLLTIEGILGDEGIGRGTNPQVAEDISVLFTRFILGFADHTFCYPGKASRAYALASPVLMRSGLQSLYWYENPNSIRRIPANEAKFWQDLPATWDELKVLEAKMAGYATYARRTGSDWFIGSLSAIERDLRIPLTFLGDGKYVAEIYADEIGAPAITTTGIQKPALEIGKYIVSKDTTLVRPLKYGHGYAARLTPATQQNIDDLPDYIRYPLIMKLMEAALLSENEYTILSWSRLAAAIAHANVVLAKAAVTQSEIDDEVAALTDAIAGLRSVKTLAEAVAEGLRLTGAHYTMETWDPFESALNAGMIVLAKAEPEQTEIDAATLELLAARAALVKNMLTPKTTSYLSDMTYMPGSYASYGNIQRDRSYEASSIALTVNGHTQTFAKGLGTHAPADVWYNIEGRGFELFESYVGINAISKPNAGDVIFRVYADDVLIYESRATGPGRNEAQRFSLPIAGVKILHLQADPNGSDNSDHADWGDAKLLTMALETRQDITSILINGNELSEFTPRKREYYIPAVAGGAVPKVTATVPHDGISYSVQDADSIPGTTYLTVIRSNDTQVVYKIHFVGSTSTYLSDLNWASTDRLGSVYGTVLKDISYENNPMAVTAGDGSAMSFAKGLGMHASIAVTYDLAGEDYDRFECWVGASHFKVYPGNNMIFIVYVDGVEKFNSGPMSYLMPAKFVSLDVSGASELKLVLDQNGADSGDHGNWADAKLLKYMEYVERSFVYVSDVDWESTDNHNSQYGTIVKDRAYENNPMAVTAPDGSAMTFNKGLGMQAPFSVTYNIEGKGYDRFECWIGASHFKVYNNSMIFMVYVDDELVYTSPAMKHLDPAAFLSIDIKEASRIRLYLDPNGPDSGDHGNWADAKFITFITPEPVFESTLFDGVITTWVETDKKAGPNLIVFTGVYTPEGVLVYLDEQRLVSIGEVSVDVSQYPLGKYRYKVFCWDENYVPVFDAIRF